MVLTCANAACRNPLPKTHERGLCWPCDSHWRLHRVPIGGFIASGDIKAIARDVLSLINPTKTDIAEALRILRGTRHPVGPWSERPAYRLQPLLKGRWNQRLPHLLVGRRQTPGLSSLIPALVHYHLAKSVLGTGREYPQYLAGATFYRRRSPIAPRQADVLTGGAKTAGYHLSVHDFAMLGRTCLRAMAKLGVDPKARWVTDKITDLYHAGLADGRYHKPIVVPYGCFATTASGDHPLDHRFTDHAPVPRRYHNEVRRASGLIQGQWPEGLDLSWEEAEATRSKARPLTTINPFTTKTCAAPDASWVFANLTRRPDDAA